VPILNENTQIVNALGFPIANLSAIVAAAGPGTAGTLTSAASPATTLSGITGPNFYLQLDGDPTPRLITLTNTDATGANIAAEIQSVARALSGVPASYAAMTCTFTNSKYVITSGAVGGASAVLVTAGPTAAGVTTDIALTTLKLLTGAVVVAGTNVGILATPYTAIETTRAKLWVTSDTAGTLYLIKDGVAVKLNAGAVVTVAVPVKDSDMILIAGSVYDLAFSAAGAKLQISWMGGM
jgi:hypothetical protein